MRKLRNSIHFGFLAAVLAFELVAGELPVWEFPHALSEWSQTARLTAIATDDSVLLDLAARDSYLVNPAVVLASSEIGGFEVEYRAEEFAEGTCGQIYYATDDSPAFGEHHALVVGSLTADGKWHKLKVPTDETWRTAGTVTKLRLDLADQFPGKIWLRRVRALPVERSRAEVRGIPTQVSVELGTAEALWTPTLYDVKATRFASPMTAPSNGGFEFVGECYLRKEFVLAELPQKVFLVTSCDDRMIEGYLNGTQLDVRWSDNWKISNQIELDAQGLRIGRNVLCLRYRNGGGLGGVMADLQVVGADDDFQVITLEGAQGFFGAEPSADWMQPETTCDWPIAETRPGAPNPPWRFTPEYRSIDPNLPKVEVSVVKQTLQECVVEFRCEPYFIGDEVFYIRVLDGQDSLLGYQSGTLAELTSERCEDGVSRIHFDLQGFGLTYGAATHVHWQLGIYGGRMTGQADFWQDLPERPLEGAPVSLKVEKTANGPRVLLNGNPFYMVSLCIEHREIPTGQEGEDSPFNVICTRAGGFMGDRSLWWVGPDEYDFSAVDRQLSFCAERYPNAWLGLYVWCHPGKWYAEMFPERLAVQDDGNVVEPRLAAGCPVAFSNEEYRQDAERAVRALVAHCEKYFGSKMVFYNLQGGITYEWQGWNSHTKFFGDYAEESQKDFQRYAKAHGMEVTGVPSRAEREAGLPGGILRDPVRDAASILYERFYSQSIAECIDRLAKVVREETHGDKLVGTYYGYHQEFASLGYCVNGGGHNDLHRLLKSPNLDFFLSPIDYRHRSIGAPSSDMKPYGAIRAAGKLALSEDDTRTNLIAPTIFDQTVNLDQTLAVLKRNHGVALTRGMALNHLPLVGGTELDAPEIRELFRHTALAGQMMVEENVSPKAEIAVVLDEEAIALFVPTLKQIFIPDNERYHYDPATGKLSDTVRGIQALSGELFGDQQLALSQCGAPVDWMMLQEPQS
ncbi:MAG: beta-galactosidase, partial [Victivallales bacterium]|nr:beta-galactosidase [Victivallales bacterium]